MEVKEAQDLLGITDFTDMAELIQAVTSAVWKAQVAGDLGLIRRLFEAMVVMMRSNGRMSEEDAKMIMARNDAAITRMTAKFDQNDAAFSEKIQRNLVRDLSPG